jgi:hypothetical protein
MTLYTDRRAVQVKEADPFNPESQFDALVVRIDELSDDDRAELDRSFDVEWSNETFKLVRRSAKQTYHEMMDWMSRHSLVPSDEMWEFYLTDPANEPDPAKWETRVVWPVVPISV